MIFFAVDATTWRSQCGRFEIRAEAYPPPFSSLQVFIVLVNAVTRHVAGTLSAALSWCGDQVADA